MSSSKKNIEKPADENSYFDDTETDAYSSDYFEMRFCEFPGCETPLPLDRPGKYITYFGQRCLVCDGCHKDHTAPEGY